VDALQIRTRLDPVRLTAAETRETTRRDLRLRLAARRGAIAADHPVTRVNLDWT
jgi:hypothetical protein